MVQAMERSDVIVAVTGRNVQVPDHYRSHVEEKLAKLERYDHKITRFDVVLLHEKNRRQADKCQRIEVTSRGKGPAVRAEASAKDFYTALDMAVAKLETRLRRVADRRRVHHGHKTPTSVATATAPLAAEESEELPEEAREKEVSLPENLDENLGEKLPSENVAGVVRRKEHPAKPMSVDDALFEMELVGHDFYLFHNSDLGLPSVVYRRKGFQYGLITLTE